MTNAHKTIDRPDVGENNGLVDGRSYHAQRQSNHCGFSVHWNDPRLARITRFRILSDPGFPFWDVSYIHGILKDGRACDVFNPFAELPKRGTRSYIIECAKRDGVYAKGLGIFDAISSLC